MGKKKFLILYILICLFLLSFSFANAQPLEGKVVKIIDANTIELETKEEGNFIIKLWGIDCPEIDQPHGNEAQAKISDLLLKKKISAEVKGKDRKGVRLAIITLKNGSAVNEQMLTEGHAWAEMYYAKGFYSSHEAEARNKKIGLWAHPQQTPPWVYRRQQSMKMAKGR